MLCIYVSVFVCLSAGRDCELCQNGWTDLGSVWGLDAGLSKEPDIRWSQDATQGGSVAEWLACWTRAQRGLSSNYTTLLHDAVV